MPALAAANAQLPPASPGGPASDVVPAPVLGDSEGGDDSDDEEEDEDGDGAGDDAAGAPFVSMDIACGVVALRDAGAVEAAERAAGLPPQQPPQHAGGTAAVKRRIEEV